MRNARSEAPSSGGVALDQNGAESSCAGTGVSNASTGGRFVSGEWLGDLPTEASEEETPVEASHKASHFAKRDSFAASSAAASAAEILAAAAQSSSPIAAFSETESALLAALSAAAARASSAAAAAVKAAARAARACSRADSEYEACASRSAVSAANCAR